METRYRKIKQYLSMLKGRIYTNERNIENIEICPCDYKTNNTPPKLSEFVPYKSGDVWGSGLDSHAWFHFTATVFDDMKSKPVKLRIRSDKTGWDGDNPQFIAYIDGEMRQGLDTNHTYVALDAKKDTYDVYVYGYTGQKIPSTRFFASVCNLNSDVDALYYDILVPFEMLDYLSVHSYEYSEIIRHLDKAVSYLELYDMESEEFLKSCADAHKYMEEKFYGEYCSAERGAPVVIGIGHTHIDCAWKWTLKQTREKVQRSFATVLELMDMYPEYKFMSSQALLYKNLKEEAPDLYEEVKERVKEGRWECEGAMWVEADCNLASGESLVRQVMYGKRFFKEEFGVENRVLWLPDVFGYSAALPQILRKSGVDWFVTSKISWNETNTMPNDTFSWVGIDGTPINTYFLTAQDQRKNGEPVRYATYVGNTGSKMIAGTWHRYSNKDLNNEAILTFGHGDGGGGPTREMLEMGRRSAKGIPGAPVFKIDFAGDFLSRLEKKIENNKNLPKWRGELYLEFHRGTYTSMSKNKRDNRKSEFLYLDAELLASVEKSLTGKHFPKKDLREGWEMILTNQFHDIIPGSSVREVYEQCDIDYAVIFGIGERIVNDAKKNIASKLNKSGGYVVFNTHSFVGDGPVVIDGVTSLVSGVPGKGYKLTDEFVNKNSVKIEGNKVDTNRFRVMFDEAMQMTSIYDKKCCREVLKSGTVGNEIRLYADHPDQFDAWEWQLYSLDKYMSLTDVSSKEIIEDGARLGIRIVRPYRNSKITQTIWFWDDMGRIDFDTVADWHEHHIMAKAVFPTDVNSDKATYEIQFGTVERPTHKNTSWDKAKFEVCGHKYADISEGNFGVSLINDCKYGYDIHDGVIMLSLFKSATDPNENADQGEIPFVYSLCPHEGDLSHSETAKLAYFLNYPMDAYPALGEESVIPETFSAVTPNCDNVIAETVKESEDGSDTVIRLYEYKNCRSKIKIRTDIKFSEAYLCDLSENEICKLETSGNTIFANISGFEILTIKLK